MHASWCYVIRQRSLPATILHARCLFGREHVNGFCQSAVILEISSAAAQLHTRLPWYSRKDSTCRSSHHGDVVSVCSSQSLVLLISGRSIPPGPLYSVMAVEASHQINCSHDGAEMGDLE